MEGVETNNDDVTISQSSNLFIHIRNKEKKSFREKMPQTFLGDLRRRSYITMQNFDLKLYVTYETCRKKPSRQKNVWMNVACTVSSSFASCQSDVRQINQSSE